MLTTSDTRLADPLAGSDDPLAAATRIRRWGEAHNWQGWDPYDALNSPYAELVTLRTSLGRRILTQTVKRSPINLRPVLRIPRAHNQKAIGLVASGYAHLGAAGDATARDAASHWLDWLENGHLGGTGGMAWGYHFDVQTRFFSYPANTPNTIATTFVARAFLDAVAELGDESRIETAIAASDYLVSTVLVESRHGPYFGYVPGDDKLIHNCNLLACAVLMDTARYSGRDDLAEIATRARVHERRGATTGRIVAVLRLVGSGLGRQLPHGIRARVTDLLHGRRRRGRGTDRRHLVLGARAVPRGRNAEVHAGAARANRRPLLRPGDRYVARTRRDRPPRSCRGHPRGTAPDPGHDPT